MTRKGADDGKKEPVDMRPTGAPGDRAVKTKIKVVYRTSDFDGRTVESETTFKNWEDFEVWRSSMEESARAMGGPVGNRAYFKLVKALKISEDEPEDIRENRRERMSEIRRDIAALSLYCNDHELELLIAMLKEKTEDLEEVLKIRKASS